MATQTDIFNVTDLLSDLPEFTQVVFDMVTNGETTLERLALIGVLAPSQVDKYQALLEAPVTVQAEVPAEDVTPTDEEAVAGIAKAVENGSMTVFTGYTYDELLAMDIAKLRAVAADEYYVDSSRVSKLNKVSIIKAIEDVQVEREALLNEERQGDRD